MADEQPGADYFQAQLDKLIKYVALEFHVSWRAIMGILWHNLWVVSLRCFDHNNPLHPRGGQALPPPRDLGTATPGTPPPPSPFTPPPPG